MERILTSTNPMMCEIQCSPPENSVMEQLRAALRRVQNDLDLVAKFPSGSNQLVAHEHVHKARVAKVSTNTVRMLETCTMCSNILRQTLLCEAVRDVTNRISDVLLSGQTHDFRGDGASAAFQLPTARVGQSPRSENEIESTVLRKQLADTNVTLPAVTCSLCSQIIPTVACIERSLCPEVALKATW